MSAADGKRGGRARGAARQVVPPIAWRGLQRLRGRADATPPQAEGPPEWEYVPEGWTDERDAAAKGWNVEAIAASQRAKWPSYLKALEGSGPLGVYHEVVSDGAVGREDPGAHNMLITYGYVLARAAAGRANVSILDWGGGVGHYLPLSRALLPGVEIDYHCRDLPALCEVGRELQPDATFHSDDTCLERSYDLVLASSVLQYLREWRPVLGRLAAATSGLLYVTRVPTAFAGRSFVVLQRAYAYGYDTEYLGWVLTPDELAQEVGREGLRLEREFLLEASFPAPGAPESPVAHRGYLFAPATA